MKKTFWILSLIAMVLGLTLGHGLRVATSSTPPVAAVPAPAPAASADPRVATNMKTSTTRAPAAGTVEACHTGTRSERLRALADLYGGMSAKEFPREAGKLRDLPMDERFMATSLLFGRWAELEPVAAMAGLNKLGKDGEPFLPTVLQAWASVDPAAAADYCWNYPSRFVGLREMGGGDAAAHVAAEWSRKDPAAALGWANSLAGVSRDAAICSVLGEIAKSDPARAWDQIISASSDARFQVGTAIASAWGSIDVDAADRRIVAAKEFSDESKLRLREAAVQGLANENPAVAAAKLATLPDGPTHSAVVWSVVARQWAHEDAGAAARWVLEHSPEKDKTDQIGLMMNDYVRQDATAARTFAESLPTGRTRDYAICRYAQYALRQGKESRADLTAMLRGIVDPEISRWAHEWIGVAPDKPKSEE